LRRPYELSGTIVDASASVGVAVSPLAGENSEVLQLHADLALYEAKAAGRAQSVLYEPQLDPTVVLKHP
jgi:predicted signal transduction protein with EAL and GGDEF domain